MYFKKKLIVFLLYIVSLYSVFVFMKSMFILVFYWFLRIGKCIVLKDKKLLYIYSIIFVMFK